MSYRYQRRAQVGGSGLCHFQRTKAASGWEIMVGGQRWRAIAATQALGRAPGSVTVWLMPLKIG